MTVWCATASLSAIFKRSLGHSRPCRPGILSAGCFRSFFVWRLQQASGSGKARRAGAGHAVTQATIRRIVHGDGALFPRDQANLMPKITAPVQKFYVNRGDHVKQGQLLAVLENRDLVAAAAESKGAVEQAESNLRATEGATVPESVVKAQTIWNPPAKRATAPRRYWKAAQQLFKQGALAGRQVDESQARLCLRPRASIEPPRSI